MARYLLRRGADPAASDAEGRMVLFFAIHGGDQRLALSLIRRLCRRKIRFDSYGHCLTTAARKNLVAILRSLIRAWAKWEKAASPDGAGNTDEGISLQKALDDALGSAAGSGACEAMELLLDAGANPDAVDEVTMGITDSTPYTPLYSACINNHEQAARLLVRRGASLEAPFPGQRSPLMAVAGWGNGALYRYLSSKGAEITPVANARLAGFFLYSAAGRVDALRTFIEAGKKLTGIDECGAGALVYAARRGRLETVRFLREELGMTEEDQTNRALYEAATEGHLETVAYFLAQGMDPNTPFSNFLGLISERPLEGAAQNGHFKVVKYLLESGADPNAKGMSCWSALFRAVFWSNLDNWRVQLSIIRILLDYDADPKAPTPTGDTPLAWSMREYWNESAHALLKAKVKADAEAGHHAHLGNPVIDAVLEWNIQALSEALKSGRVVDGRDDQGRTALMYAVLREYANMVGLLLRAGARFDVVDNEGKAPLHLAMVSFDVGICNLLLDAGADIDQVDGNGKTALMHAAVAGNERAIVYLMKRGANASVRHRIDGGTALTDAFFAGKVNAAKALIAAGADVHFTGTGGMTPLMYAAALGDSSLVALILSKKADPTVVDHFGQSAADHAASAGHEDIAAWLRTPMRLGR